MHMWTSSVRDTIDTIEIGALTVRRRNRTVWYIVGARSPVKRTCILQESGHYSWLCNQPWLALLNVISGVVPWRSSGDFWERSVNAFIRVLVVARTYDRHEPPCRVVRNLDFPWIMRGDCGRFRMILTCSLYHYCCLSYDNCLMKLG